jgi:hypothetical protein
MQGEAPNPYEAPRADPIQGVVRSPEGAELATRGSRLAASLIDTVSWRARESSYSSLPVILAANDE